MSEKIVRLSIHQDDVAESPCEYDGWKLYSFSKRHCNYVNCNELLAIEEGKITATEIQKKLDSGLAFLLSCFQHGFETWGLIGEVFQCRWDTTQLAGILIWENHEEDIGATTYDERKEDARKFLEVYTKWANGDNYCYVIHYDDCKKDSYGGFTGVDSLIEILKAEHPEIFNEDKTFFREDLDVDGDCAEVVNHLIPENEQKTATFTWTVNVDVREDFDPKNPKHVAEARHEAWNNVHESYGYMEE